MGCAKCGFTGIMEEYEPESGFVDIECPQCKGVDGNMPDIVTEASDALTQEEMEAEAYASASITPERIAFEVEVAWAKHGPGW